MAVGPRGTSSSLLVGLLTVTLAGALTPAAATAAPHALDRSALDRAALERSAPDRSGLDRSAPDPSRSGRQSGTTAAGERWSADLTVVGGDDVNVRFGAGLLRLADPRPTRRNRPAALHAPVAEGVLLAPVRTLAGPANRVRAALTAEAPTGAAVGVQVRGWQGTGWTEWREAGTAPAAFDRPVSRVQARVLLTTRDAWPPPRYVRSSSPPTPSPSRRPPPPPCAATGSSPPGRARSAG